MHSCTLSENDYSYNITRENVKKGMEILIQAKVPISRPDDFFAEMLKTD